MALEKMNPATKAGQEERKRIPMSVPVQKLEVPEIPGYHLHWFRGDAARIQRAQSAGYEFVDDAELKVRSVGLGSDSAKSGNTDMGSRVSIVAGDEIGKDGQPTRLILMKIKREWYEEDQKLVDDRNEQVASSLRGGMLGREGKDSGELQHRYVDKTRTKIPDLFKPKPNRAKPG